MYWKISLNNVLYILQSNINSCGKTNSLKDLIFVEILNTISSWKIWSYNNNAISWLTFFLWFHASKFPRSESLHISHSQIIGPNSQFNKRQISDKCKQIIKAWSQLHSVDLLTVNLLNINLMHLDLLSIRLLNRASSLWVCTSPQKTWH